MREFIIFLTLVAAGAACNKPAVESADAASDIVDVQDDVQLDVVQPAEDVTLSVDGTPVAAAEDVTAEEG